MAKGIVVGFKKDAGFGTLTVEGQQLPFDYEACGNFGDHPHEGDVVEVTVGTSRLGRPKATQVLFVAHGPPPGAGASAAPAAPASPLEGTKSFRVDDARHFDALAVARGLAGLFPELGGVARGIESKGGQLFLEVPIVQKVVAAPVRGPEDVAKLFNYALSRLLGSPERVFPVAKPGDAGMTFHRAPLAPVQAGDPQRKLPVLWSKVEPSRR